MWKKISIFICAVVTAALAGIWINDSFPRTQRADPLVPQKALIKTNFFMPEVFYSGDRESEAIEDDQRVIAVLVPHHLIAGKEISKIFKLLQSKGYTEVFIIGPNHYVAGQANILTSDADFETPFGVQRGSQWIGYPRMAPELLEDEHSVMGLMPYVKFYLAAEAQPFIIKAKTSREELDALAHAIDRSLGDHAIAIFSIDFSHYLPKGIADKNDARTAAALLALDQGFVYNLDNDYLDSPPSLVVMFMLCRARGAKFKIIDHTNSADLIGQPKLMSTTSHFTGYCAI